jgi:hypothetical protein
MRHGHGKDGCKAVHTSNKNTRLLDLCQVSPHPNLVTVVTPIRILIKCIRNIVSRSG